MTHSLRECFLLDPDVVFLNHGSFGATPKPVFDACHMWRLRLESQPVQFLGTDIGGYLTTAREALGRYLNAAANELVYVPNATFGVNVVARSLHLGPDDEVLATDHEYGACENVWPTRPSAWTARAESRWPSASTPTRSPPRLTSTPTLRGCATWRATPASASLSRS